MDLDATALDNAIREAKYLDAHLTDMLFALPRRGGTDLQKGARSRIRAEVNRLRDLRQYLDFIKGENES